MSISNAFLSFVLITLSYTSVAQETGNIEVHADPRIDALVKKQGSINPGANSPQISGFRVQLMFDPDKKTIDDARSRFTATYPNVDTYVMFNAPNFFLKVGDFRTQLEAEKLKDKVNSDFPTCFIIKEQVNLPRIDQN
jgi:hypothetical protein